MRLRNYGLLRNALLCTSAIALAYVLSPAGAQAATQINEIRTDNTGTDSDEYFEIKGTPTTSLATMTYIVIGDGSGANRCGVIESVTALSALTPNAIQADGYYAVCKEGPSSTPPASLSGYDVTGVSTMNFENSDNVTHMLVIGFTGTANQDLDTNDDGVLDITPWTSIVDAIALVGPGAVDCVTANMPEHVYSANQIGPDGTFVPSHIYRCNDTNVWTLGSINLPPQGVDTPGAQNLSCAAAPPSIKLETRDLCAPTVAQAVAVTDSVVGATSATLHYSINGGADNTLAMSSAPTNRWTATIPGQAVNATRISYYVIAHNANGDDTGFTWGYFVGTKTIGSLRVNDVDGVNIYKFYGVRVTGVVTSNPSSFSALNTDFYVQDATGGFNIFQNDLYSPMPALGNDITACGVLNQFNGNLEITKSSSVPAGLDIDINGAGVLPTPLLVNTCESGESTEGKLVRMQFPVVDTTGSNSTTWVSGRSYDITNCQGSTVDLNIDPDSGIAGGLIKSKAIDVTGIATQFDSNVPLNAGYRIVPRSPADIIFVNQGVSGVVDPTTGLRVRLLPSNPNPFSAHTTLRYEISQSSTPDARTPVRLTVFDVQGKVVKRVVDATQGAGAYEVQLSADDLGGARSGVFFYSLDVNGVRIATQKLVLSR